MNFLDFDSKRERWAASGIALFYLIGALGVLSPYKDSFLLLTPFHLLTVSALLAWAHKGQASRLAIFFLIAFGAGFGVEVLGVNTGFPFGDYSYGQALGPKLLGTPYMIGVNWALVAYMAWGSLGLFNFTKTKRSLLAALLLVTLDIILEPAAINVGFWTWEHPAPPLQNYLAWFVVAFLILFMSAPYLAGARPKICILTYCLNFIFFVLLVIV